MILAYGNNRDENEADNRGAERQGLISDQWRHVILLVGGHSFYTIKFDNGSIERPIGCPILCQAANTANLPHRETCDENFLYGEQVPERVVCVIVAQERAQYEQKNDQVGDQNNPDRR